MNNRRISVHICTNERIIELCILLESLRKQTYQAFDILVLDDGSTNCPFNNEIFQKLMNRIKLEKHCVELYRNDYKTGLCKARNKLIEEDRFNNEFVFRCDDDVVLEKDFLERMIKGIDAGYDMVSGITPALWIPEVKRRTKIIKPMVNKVIFNPDGTVKQFGDDCLINVTNESINFSTKGDIGDGDITLYKDNIKLEVVKPVKLMFSIDHLINFTKSIS